MVFTNIQNDLTIGERLVIRGNVFDRRFNDEEKLRIGAFYFKLCQELFVFLLKSIRSERGPIIADRRRGG